MYAFALLVDPDGGFLTDGTGQVVIPAVDLEALRRLAQVGGGRFAQLSPDDSDLEALFPRPSALSGVPLGSGEESEYEADVWREQGVWLALLLLPLVALSFRRGWVCAVAAALVLPIPEAQALEWADLWLRGDQRGFAAMEQQNPAAAVAHFEDPEWRGAAEYRAGVFEASAATLSQANTPDGLYNRGNALARAGQLEAAIQAYDRVLELTPDHEDAEYNRDLLQQLLDENQDESEDQEGENSEQGEQEQSDDSSGAGEQGDSGESTSEDEQSAAESQADSESGEGDSEQNQNSENSGDSEASDGDTRQAESDASTEDQELQASASEGLPEDIEEWASDQAADQWLRRVPQDPGGLLRRKFLYQYRERGGSKHEGQNW